MIVRSIDNVGDWNFGKGRNDYKRLVDAIQQSVRTRLQSFLGDCFFAQTEGIDWFNLLGAKDTTELGLAISAIILNTPDVTKIENFSFNTDENRNVTFQYEIQTVYGTSTNSFQINLGVS